MMLRKGRAGAGELMVGGLSYSPLYRGLEQLVCFFKCPIQQIGIPFQNKESFFNRIFLNNPSRQKKFVIESVQKFQIIL